MNVAERTAEIVRRAKAGEPPRDIAASLGLARFVRPLTSPGSIAEAGKYERRVFLDGDLDAWLADLATSARVTPEEMAAALIAGAREAWERGG